ncbi:MAG: hypothetical protein NTZ05_01790 [Chloroflexi bacterium]|nr:hypothetical protein [Chloroflexota bacterium]
MEREQKRRDGRHNDAEAAVERTWTFPHPEPDERVLHAWVIDQCHYVLIALAVALDAAGPEAAYRLRVFGYTPSGETDQWTAASPGPWDTLRAKVNEEMASLAAVWSGRLRQADLSVSLEWYDTMADVLADGIVQVAPKGEAA